MDADQSFIMKQTKYHNFNIKRVLTFYFHNFSLQLVAATADLMNTSPNLLIVKRVSMPMPVIPLKM